MRRPRIAFHPNSSSGVPTFLFGAISLGAGIRHDSPLCLAMGVSMLTVPVAVYLLLRWTAGRVKIRRVVRDRAFEGDSVEVKLLLRNESRFSLFYPVVAEVFTPEVHAQKTVVFPYRVRPGELAAQTYQGDCILPRGVYTLGPTCLSLSDPFGWFQVKRVVTRPSTIKIYPRFPTLEVRDRLGACLSLLYQEITRFGIGDSNEFFSVREYRVGDPLRRVHWPLSAHRGYPVVRENTRTAVGDLHLFLDLYRYALLGVGRGSSLEQAVKITAALASQALRKGHRVELTAQGSSEVHVPAAKGAGHLQSILDALVETRPDGRVPLDRLVDRMARRIAPGSLAVFMVSPYLQSSAEFREHLLALVRRNVRVVLVVFDDSTFRNLYDLRRKEHCTEEFAADMRRLGMEAFFVPCGGDLSALFSRQANCAAAGGTS